MIKTKLYKASELAKIVEGELFGDDCQIEYISLDSRENLNDNSCFFAINGEKYNGEEFVYDAIKSGASLVITTRKKPLSCSFIYVNDVKSALFKLAKHNKGNTKIIGITGSVGKTTVKEIIFSILKQRYKTCATLDNQNNEIGVSLTLLSIIDEEYCVVEMGMRGLGEIAFLSKMCEPEISIITNIGSAHIERLGSIENIIKAKSEILFYTSKIAVVPSSRVFKNLDYGSLKVMFVGENGEVRADKIEYLREGIKFKIIDNNLNEADYAIIHSFAPHDVENSLLAYSAARACNLTFDMIKQGIFEFKNCKNRGHVYKIGELTVIDDCYNASFESVKGAINGLLELSKIENKKPVVLLGDMLELGDNSKEYHIKIGEFLKEKHILEVLTLGEHASFICQGFGGGICFSNKEDAIEYILKNLGQDALLLIKASRKLNFEKIIEQMKERKNEN